MQPRRGWAGRIRWLAMREEEGYFPDVGPDVRVLRPREDYGAGRGSKDGSGHLHRGVGFLRREEGREAERARSGSRVARLHRPLLAGLRQGSLGAAGARRAAGEASPAKAGAAEDHATGPDEFTGELSQRTAHPGRRGGEQRRRAPFRRRGQRYRWAGWCSQWSPQLLQWAIRPAGAAEPCEQPVHEPSAPPLPIAHRRAAAAPRLLAAQGRGEERHFREPTPCWGRELWRRRVAGGGAVGAVSSRLVVGASEAVWQRATREPAESEFCLLETRPR
mmetsp:Transcript_128653/g.412125  ORF Transcript_128653/g.412125 Transcript_128653/m.412125 type:complete len:276 (+) Transcript_128653:1463-2290(+)